MRGTLFRTDSGAEVSRRNLSKKGKPTRGRCSSVGCMQRTRMAARWGGVRTGRMNEREASLAQKKVDGWTCTVSEACWPGLEVARSVRLDGFLDVVVELPLCPLVTQSARRDSELIELPRAERLNAFRT